MVRHEQGPSRSSFAQLAVVEDTQFAGWKVTPGSGQLLPMFPTRCKALPPSKDGIRGRAALGIRGQLPTKWASFVKKYDYRGHKFSLTEISLDASRHASIITCIRQTSAPVVE